VKGFDVVPNERVEGVRAIALGESDREAPSTSSLCALPWTRSIHSAADRGSVPRTWQRPFTAGGSGRDG